MFSSRVKILAGYHKDCFIVAFLLYPPYWAKKTPTNSYKMLWWLSSETIPPLSHRIVSFPTLRADKPTMLFVVFSFKQTRHSWFVANFWLKYFEPLKNQLLRHCCCKYLVWRTNYHIIGKESRYHHLLFLGSVFPRPYTFSANICSYHQDNVVQHSCLCSKSA